MLKNIYPVTLVFFVSWSIADAQTNTAYKEQYRPQIHFSPKAHWMNDPNGMVYFENTYHLFFQYYPDSTVWGPMHWGHAISTDLVHWKEQPIALYPDKLGYIFSGSAVADVNNTSGFGKKGKIPLIAIYTNHDAAAEKAGKNNFQNQSIAYSLDNGKTWMKYSGNPVLKNPGITDFRDPKVNWYAPGKKWIMTLAVKDHITFYSSANLKDWTLESEFGKAIGAHGGVWECPDIFTLDYNGSKVWVLIVNINPGGTNGGSATQYFTGSFDGKTFTPDNTSTKWLDYGPDEYAGVTWSNTGNRKIFFGWMSNWNYANVVPTVQWRSAMTLPRELSITKVNDTFYVTSMPVKELNKIASPAVTFSNIKVTGNTVPVKTGNLTSPYRLTVKTATTEDFSFIFSNEAEEKLIVGYDKVSNQYYIDRTNAGRNDFSKSFTGKHTAPRITNTGQVQLTMIIDHTSIELFADNGLTTMTGIFFPKELMNKIHIQSTGNWMIQKLEVSSMKNIW